MCTMLAPASYARLASSAISTGVYGMAGQCFLVVTAPVSAHERMTLSVLIAGGERCDGRRALSRQRLRPHGQAGRQVGEIADDPAPRVAGDEGDLVPRRVAV